VSEFLAAEAAGGVVLLAATVVALAWANSPWRSSYAELWSHEVSLGVRLDLRHWINEGLMTLFFLVVALEIRRELREGELRERRAAALPICAALGGMVAPAAVYLLVTAGSDGTRGWGIPMATDIAFAVAAVSALGRRVAPSVRVFLLALAIVDDIGAIVVIAVFYGGTEGWAVLAAVVVALVLPKPIAATVERRLHPWTGFVVVPLFALANAGLYLGGGVFHDAVATPITWGVVLGLVVGKPLGIVGASALAVRLRVGVLPAGAGWRQLLGAAAIAGIGFTVSLFIAGLAFTDPSDAAAATVGVLTGSLVAAAMGALVLTFWSPKT
jgi:NhaA family Na+:H+ antiporter